MSAVIDQAGHSDVAAAILRARSRTCPACGGVRGPWLECDVEDPGAAPCECEP